MDDVRSSGEIGADIGLGLEESIGEIKPGQSIVGKIDSSAKNAKSRYDVKGKKLDPLGQTIDYEGGNGNSRPTISAQEDEISPIYDSKDDPIPKQLKKGNGMKNNVFMSGESFGKNPLNRSSGGIDV